jgi:DNA-binding CsgD family transcriptional regulator
MDYNDFAGLDRKTLLERFERERQEWLAAGMSDDDISRVHFGEEDEKGRGGDYGVWLSERARFRTDHKYAPGAPVAIDTVDPDGAWISGGRGGLDSVEYSVDLERAMASLTDLQRRYFTLNRLEGYGYAEIARRDGKERSTIKRLVAAAEKKIKKYF